MPVYTTIPRVQVKWQGDNPPPLSTEAYELNIADGFKLNVGEGYNLTISPEGATLNWSKQAKGTGSSWPAPAPTVSVVQLNIGDGYELNIGSGYALNVGTSTGGTIWTPLNKL